jgi:hypothetical protein
MKKLRAGQKLDPSEKIPLIPYDIASTWEIAYNHYANRKGLVNDLPNTKKILTIIRAKAPAGQHLPKGTPANADGLREFPGIDTPLFATGIGASTGWISSWEALTHGSNLDAAPAK